MLTYIIEVSICWLVFYLLYMVLFRQETFFRINRFYLLSTLLLGLIIPWLDLSWLIDQPSNIASYYLQPVTVTMQAVEVTLEEVVITPLAEKSNWNWQFILIAGYFTGVIICSCRFIIGLYKIHMLRRRSELIQMNSYTLVQTPVSHLPFSFLNSLFWSREMRLDPEEHRQILQHELAHIHQKHSIDVILLEVITILFWCSPFIHFYNKALRNIHEYLADEEVLFTTATKPYGHMLLRQSQSGLLIALAHNLIHSQLKKRILMMTKNKSRHWALVKYSSLLPVLAVLLLLFSGNTTTATFDHYTSVISTSDYPDFDAETVKNQLGSIVAKYDNKDDQAHRKQVIAEFEAAFNNKLTEYPAHKDEIAAIARELIEKMQVPYRITNTGGAYQLIYQQNAVAQFSEESFKVVEEMPRFPGCESVADAQDRKQCSEQKLMRFIMNTLKYPKEAITSGVEGVVVTRFIVDKTGQIKNAEIVRSVGSGCDEAVLEVVAQMPEWIPGKQRGKAVNVEFNLPVKFKMSKQDNTKADAKAEKYDKETFKVVEQMPRFPGCEDESLSGEELSRCSNQKLISFIIDNIKYPAAAKAAGTEGVVVAQFVVNKQGRLEDAEIVKAVGDGCDEEVLRLIGLMNEMPEAWIPGRQKGEVVSVSFKLPIKFALPKEPYTSGNDQYALQMEEFTAFPNPASDQISLSFKTGKGPVHISLVDAAGKVIFDKEMNNYDGSILDQKIDVSDAARGNVFIKIVNTKTEKVFTKALILQ